MKNDLIRTETDGMTHISDQETAKSEIILEFKIDGMTCVNCSNTIENAMKLEYESKGLISVKIALLTHKMRITFDMKIYQESQITPEMICEEVEMVGFGIELLEVIENN